MAQDGKNSKLGQKSLLLAGPVSGAYAMKNEQKKSWLKKRGNAFSLHKQLDINLNSTPFCLVSGVRFSPVLPMSLNP